MHINLPLRKAVNKPKEGITVQAFIDILMRKQANWYNKFTKRQPAFTQPRLNRSRESTRGKYTQSYSRGYQGPEYSYRLYSSRDQSSFSSFYGQPYGYPRSSYQYRGSYGQPDTQQLPKERQSMPPARQQLQITQGNELNRRSLISNPNQN